jgi:subfamily B ATP-binding cassette protein MsbA
MLKLYLRLLRFMRPHLKILIISVLCMTGYAAFSGGIVALVVPFSRLIFYGGEIDGTGAPAVSAPQKISPGAPAGSSIQSPLPSTPTAPPENRLATIKRLQNGLRDRTYSLVRGRDRTDTLKRFCFLVLLVFVIKNIFWYAQNYLIVVVEQGVIRDLRNALYRHYLKLPVEYYNEARAGMLVSRITNDVTVLRGGLANGVAQGLRQTLLVIAYLIAVLSANWRLFLLTLLVAPPAFYLIDRIARRLRRYSSRSQEKMADLTGALQETIGGVRVVKAFNLEGHMRDRFQRINQAFASATIRMNRAGALAPPVTEILGASVGVLTFYIGGREIIRGTGMDAGSFLMFIVALFALMQPIRTLSSVNIEIQQGLAAAARIFDVLDTTPTIRERADAKAVPSPIREVRFERVDFSYVEGVPVLSGIDFRVSAGTMVAIVGPSGAGKTTLVDMIPRFYDPQSGRVTVNGIDLRDLSIEGLRGTIGVVTQETVLFDDTIEANIALGRPGATREEIAAACHAANADVFIESLPDGYATPIGDRGVKLSGGQRQRLAIARAILKNPPILVLDEATSSLDSESEALVQEAIERLVVARTTFVIAHRLSTVRRADRILVLEAGRLVDEGTHEDLLRRDGLYRRLYDMQFRDFPTAARPQVARGPEVAQGPEANRREVSRGPELGRIEEKS